MVIPISRKGETFIIPTMLTPNLKVDYSQSHYDFDAMPLKKETGMTTAQFKGVAKLMYDLGVAVNMEYGASGSGAVNANIPGALQLYYKYSPEMQMRFASSYSAEEWKTMVREEINKDRPLLYMGEENNAPHAYVIDGYKDKLFSINWGWGGQYNGYYAIGDIIEDGEQTKYNEKASALFNLQPLKEKRSNVTLTTAASGTLQDVAKDCPTLLDTLTLKGPINMNDLNTLRTLGMRHLDARDAEIVTFNNYYEGNTVFDMAFYGMKRVWSVICPRDITAIGRDGFRACEDLSTIVIPQGVTSISDKAFANCSRLLDIVMMAQEPPVLGANVFDGSYVEKQGTLHVPAGCSSKYKAAAGWKTFSKIVEDANEDIYTGIAHTTTSASSATIDYQVEGHTLKVNTAGEVRIYNTNGTLVSKSRQTTLPSGLYFIEIQGRSAKVLIP